MLRVELESVGKRILVYFKKNLSGCLLVALFLCVP